MRMRAARKRAEDRAAATGDAGAVGETGTPVAGLLLVRLLTKTAGGMPDPVGAGWLRRRKGRVALAHAALPIAAMPRPVAAGTGQALASTVQQRDW